MGHVTGIRAVILHRQRSRSACSVQRLRRAAQQADGELRLADWRPWIGAPLTGTGQNGLFDRWQKNALHYLVPETGEIFKALRSSAG
jgi:hypothetical protein